MKRSLPRVAISSFALSLMAACGNTSPVTPPVNLDGGQNPDLTMTVAPDMAMRPDMAQTPVAGTKLIAGSFGVVGTTSDDFAIAFDNDTGEVVAVPVAGGAKQQVHPLGDNAQIDHKVVFVGASLDQLTGVGELWMWTAKSGSKMLAALSLTQAAASTDGSYAAWSGNAAADGSTTDLFVGKTDGTGAVKVFTGALNDDTCYPDFAFHGSVLLMSHCEKGGTGATLHLVDPATGKATLLADKLAPSYTADKAGTKALVIGMDGKGSVINVADAKPTLIGAMDDGVMLPDASGVVYLVGTTASRYTIAGGATVKLAATVSQLLNADGFGYDLSPDGKWLIYPDAIDQNSGTAQLYLLSTQMAQTPLKMVADSSGAVYGDAFTKTSSHAIYFSNATNGFGPVHTQPVGGAKAVNLGTGKGWTAYGGKGQTVVWNDNYVPDPGGGIGTADIFAVDAATGGAGTLLVAGADEDFALTDAGDKAIFTVATMGQEGLYAIAVP